MTSRLIALGIDKMSYAEREDLIEEIRDSLPEPEQTRFTPEFAAELRRRVASAEADPTLAIPWEEVRASLLRRHGFEP